MTIRLTEEQRLAVEAESLRPPRVAVGEQEYVLLRAEVYEQMKAVLEAEEIDLSLYEFDEVTNP